ncbi:EmrB/QacA family drug resistance transporter, partial [Leclercia adecarboxylata]|nr:EmrB/QacA family drug resistance transporter [Leclercia adecarboxylata]
VAWLVDIDDPDPGEIWRGDYLGILLLAVGLGTLEYVLEDGARWNWLNDTTIRRCAGISAVSGVLFVARSLTYAHPVVDLRALGNRNFAIGCFVSLVTGVGVFSTIYLTPLFLEYVRAMPAWQTGLAMISTGIA